MVYIHFPSNLTEEELMLQTKYQKLKKKKKALQALKTPKQEPEKPLIPKRPADARDAREVARKLIKSGAIQAIQKPQSKQDQVSFKRPKGQERKRVLPESPATVATYQPFSATQATAEAGAPTGAPIDPEKEVAGRVQNLYQQLATERDREERGLLDKKAVEAPVLRPDKPRTGNTIYVSGNKVTEDFLRKHFASFGTIVNVSMEIEKGRGFITFSKAESAEKAIHDMHGKPASGIQLQVQLARRQPQIEPINDASSSAVWSTLAASHSQKGSLKDKREMVHYDDMFSS
ncbi:negative elongation factor E [Lutzomyia longipalpis]|uniref:negative elongation factor E n=1 Tax=Lutzomyia longipalpis TaxID=7200 RepID=UPI002483A449|nr:negative elongation factor E [Lutzomyia longipalpis]